MVVLFDDSYMEDVILAITSISGSQVTMIDAVSGTRNLSQAIPMFAEFVGMGGKRFCKVLLACVSIEEPAVQLLEALEEFGLKFTESGIGEIYTLPLAEAVVVETGDLF